MAFIFCGSSAPKDLIRFEKAIKNPKHSSATVKRENYLLEAIKNSKYRKVFFITTVNSHDIQTPITKDVVIGNITYVLLGNSGRNRYTRILSLSKSFFIWMVRNIKRNDTISVYNFPLIYSISILCIKPFRSFSLMIDLEDLYNRTDYRFYLNYIFVFLGIKSANYFLVSSPEMVEYIKSKNNSSTIHQNGGYLEKLSILSEKEKSNQIRLCYSGSLDKERGVLDLIKSFSSNIDNNFILIITGSGPLSEVIKGCSLRDSRIVFLGLLDDAKYEKVILNSDICINSQWEKISINFPSKVTMYLSSGKLVLSTKHTALYGTEYGKFIEFYSQINDDFWKKIYYLLENNSISFQAEKKRKNIFFDMANLKAKKLTNYINTTIVK